jgi:uncharacterized membrane protein YeaQ/YmgE (transglycosylase-associated protein family)
MGFESFIIFLLIGGIAGWLASVIVRGAGFGLFGDIVVGIFGAVIAGYILPAAGVSFGAGILASIAHATFGAIILLLIIKLIKRA